MDIVLLENDALQAEQIEHDIRTGFAPTGVQIERIRTEHEFGRRLESIVQRRPDVVIMDVMVRWADPGPEIPPPPHDVNEEGHFRAGLRCARLLTEKAPQVPIILYSVLDRRDLAGDLLKIHDVCFLTKQADVSPLIETIREVIRKQAPGGPI